MRQTVHARKIRHQAAIRRRKRRKYRGERIIIRQCEMRNRKWHRNREKSRKRKAGRGGRQTHHRINNVSIRKSKKVAEKAKYLSAEKASVRNPEIPAYGVMAYSLAACNRRNDAAIGSAAASAWQHQYYLASVSGERKKAFMAASALSSSGGGV